MIVGQLRPCLMGNHLRRRLVRCVSTTNLPETGSKSSHIKSKLDYFLQTGQVSKFTSEQLSKKFNKRNNTIQYQAAKSSYSLQKVLLLLKAKYDTHIFHNEDGSILSLEKLKASDLKIDSNKSLSIFKSLIKFKTITKKSLDKKLLLTLLGTNSEQLKDPFLVTKDTLKLLERDNETTRAEQLVRIAGPKNGVVAMNGILQWLLEKGDISGGLKNFNIRKKWNIPPNEQTYVILFSGLAKSLQWGDVKPDLTQKCLDIFDRIANESDEKKPKYTIEQFNSCLSVLVKDFNNQELSWSFFNRLVPDPNSKEVIPIPNTQTFTILLNGLKKFSSHQCELVKNDRNLTNDVKTLKLLEIQQELVSVSKIILGKVFDAATPPVPPSKEEAEMNPNLLVEYKKNMRRTLVDIDETFASTFISCFINNFSGTSISSHQGSHYKYIQQGLKYLRFWTPEIDQMFNFIENDANKKAILRPSPFVSHNTDSRIKKSIEYYKDHEVEFEFNIDDVLPENTVKDVEKKDVNPLVVFPPSPFSKNKNRAILSGKQKFLVDFTRPKHSDVKLIQLDKQYRDSKGKYGKKLPIKLSINLEKKEGINKFLLLLAMDGLVKLGRYEESYLAIWFMLNKWGGIKIDLNNRIGEIGNVLDGILKDEEFPTYIGHVSKSEVTSKSKDSDSNIVDIMLVENFIFKIDENLKQSGKTSTNLSIEIVSALIDNNINISGTLRPRFKTFDAIFSSLIKDIHYYNDHNYNKLRIDKKEKNIPNNTPKKSINNQQMGALMSNLCKFMDSLLYNERNMNANLKYLLPNKFVEPYNKIIDRLYKTTWIDMDETQITSHHKKIIKSGILFYRPKELIDPREGIIYPNILNSIEIVYKKLKEDDNLDEKDRKLYHSLKNLFRLKNEENALDKLESIAKSIHRAID